MSSRDGGEKAETDFGDRMDAVVCGIDPGLGTTGYAVLGVLGDARSLIEAGICRFDDALPLANRLVAIEQDVSSILIQHRPTMVAVEQIYSHYLHPRTAILMGHARGVILLAAAKLNIGVRSYAATQIKRYLTGNGRASKMQVQRAVQVTLALTELPQPPDAADAIAIALCGAGQLTQVEPTEATR